MSEWFVEGWFYVVAACGAAVTYFWRGLGVVLAGRMRQNSDALVWITCVAYALLAALIARMIVLPSGPLGETDLGARLAAAGLALLVYFAFGRNLLLGVVAGAAGLALLSLGDLGPGTFR